MIKKKLKTDCSLLKFFPEDIFNHIEKYYAESFFNIAKNKLKKLINPILFNGVIITQSGDMLFSEVLLLNKLYTYGFQQSSFMFYNTFIRTLVITTDDYQLMETGNTIIHILHT